MPLPQLTFEDASGGIPRKAVPVRLACLCAQWPPQTLAALVTGELAEGYPPLLTVYEYDPIRDRVGQVGAKVYRDFLGLAGDSPDVLSKLPSTHFVWSDELVLAYSHFVDLAIGRDQAWGTGAGILWEPALGECAAVISECVDVSALNVPAVRRTQIENGIRTFFYDGVKVQLKDSMGFRYISYLLLHPGEEFPVAELFGHVNKSLPHSATAGAADLTIEGAYESRGEEVFDEDGKRSIEEGIGRLVERRKIALEQGDSEKAAILANEIRDAQKYLSANLNHKGQPRRLGSEREKVRKSVSVAIQRALAAIERANVLLAEHLRLHISTGSCCVYKPPSGVRWSP